jgi:hypothetical protein
VRKFDSYYKYTKGECQNPTLSRKAIVLVRQKLELRITLQWYGEKNSKAAEKIRKEDHDIDGRDKKYSKIKPYEEGSTQNRASRCNECYCVDPGNVSTTRISLHT